MTPTAASALPLRRARRGSMSVSPPAPGSRQFLESVKERLGVRAEQPLLPVLRQPLTGGMLFREALEELKDHFSSSGSRCSRDLGRGAGHSDPQRPARRREGEGALALAGAGGQRRSRLHPRPAGMAIEATCKEIGIAADRIHVERFVSRTWRQAAPEGRRARQRAAEGNGRARRHEVPVTESKAILDAARAGRRPRSPARAACARPAAPSWSRARPR